MAPIEKKEIMTVMAVCAYFYEKVSDTKAIEIFPALLVPTIQRNIPAPPIQTFTLQIVMIKPIKIQQVLTSISVFLPTTSPRKVAVNIPIIPPLYIKVIIRSIYELYELQR